MNTLNITDLIRIKANSALNPKQKSSLGQYFSPSPICLFMASLYEDISGEVKLLDPGCGPGSLTAAFVDEAIKRNSTTSLSLTAYDVDPLIENYIDSTLSICKNFAKGSNTTCVTKFILDDFILSNQNTAKLNDYSHIIINPPYKKIGSKSEHRLALKSLEIDTANLYTGFLALSIKLLQDGGELVGIIPRSFCNGPYYQSFRELLLKETAIKHIHIFDSRSNPFSHDKVLQENIIIHLIKGGKQNDVKISSSPIADFYFDDDSQTITATDKTIREVPFSSIVIPKDKRKFIHISANERDQNVVKKLSQFKTNLKDLHVDVSTGPVVDFRLKTNLRKNPTKGSVPLIYPVHLNGEVNWPVESKKHNAINVSNTSKPLLWNNDGYYVLVRRFSSKEENRRIVASVYRGNLPGKLIGFENKLNVYHHNKTGFDELLAKGLYIFLNCSLVDKYYRIFGGHTQVNATDLRSINYPDLKTLRRIGLKIETYKLTQKEIDVYIDEELTEMNNDMSFDPILAQDKIDQALHILKELGMPKAQLNERSALTLLALVNLKPEKKWHEIEMPMIGVTPIMTWCKNYYGKNYAPNTRETFRRQTLHQFVDGGISLYNPDDPERAVNSPKACYQVALELFDVLIKYETNEWKPALNKWLKNNKTLVQQYANKREMIKIPLTLHDGTEIKLSPGDHSQLIHDIIVKFGPLFAPGAQVVYIGDTGAKSDYFKKDLLKKLGVKLNKKGKLPDVVLYCADKNWLMLIESVTSHGPVDGKRHNELLHLFKEAKAGLVFVTAFPNRSIMKQYIPEISWETEVWVSEAPTHMIHFNGDRFLGPH